MNRIRRGHKLLALAAASTLDRRRLRQRRRRRAVEDTTATEEPRRAPKRRAGTEAPADTDGRQPTRRSATAGTDGEEASRGGRVPHHLRSICPTTAVWERRFRRSRRPTSSAPSTANLNTPGSLSTTGYDKITSASKPARRDKQVVVDVRACLRARTRRSSTRMLEGRRSSRTATTCRTTSKTASRSRVGRMARSSSWTHEQLGPRPEPENYWGDASGQAERIVIVRSPIGRHDAAEVRRRRLHLPAVLHRHQTPSSPTRTSSTTSALGGSYEALYFQSAVDETALVRSPTTIYREAFSQSIDLERCSSRSTRRSSQGRRC